MADLLPYTPDGGLAWTVHYRTAEEPIDAGPLLSALAELVRSEGACVRVVDSQGAVVLDVAPDDDVCAECAASDSGVCAAHPWPGMGGKR